MASFFRRRSRALKVPPGLEEYLIPSDSTISRRKDEQEAAQARQNCHIYEVQFHGLTYEANQISHILMEKGKKDLLEGRSNQQHFLECYKREVRILSRLKHPNIVQFVGIHLPGADVLKLALVVEKRYTDLRNLVLQRIRLPLPNKLNILRDVVSGLRYLHLQNINHCDLTAGNVHITEDLQGKIVDLGVARCIYPKSMSVHTPGGTTILGFSAEVDMNSLGDLILFFVTEGKYTNSTQAGIKQDSARPSGTSESFGLKGQECCLLDIARSCLRDGVEGKLSMSDIEAEIDKLIKSNPRKIFHILHLQQVCCKIACTCLKMNDNI